MKNRSRFSLGLFVTLLALVTAICASAQIAQGVTRTKIHGIDVIAYKTGVKDVVYLRGSLPAGDDKSPAGNSMIATLTGAMLDRGTTKQDKFAIAGTVAECRAQIERLKKTGIQQIAIIPYSAPGGGREETLRGFAEAMR